MTVRTIDDIFRDFVIDGVPASGPFNPYKPDIRDTLKKLLEGLSTFPDNRVIRLNNANEGTANKIVVTASVAIPAAAFQVLYILNVTQENTGPVTVSGAINRALVTNTGAPIPSGYLTPGMAVLCLDTGSELRMLSYGAVEAIVEQLAERAEVAAEAAEAAAGNNWSSVDTRDTIPEISFPNSVKYLRTSGQAQAGDGRPGLFVDEDTGSDDTVVDAGGRTFYRAGEFLSPGLGAVPRPFLSRGYDRGIHAYDFMSEAEQRDSRQRTTSLDHTASLQRFINATLTEGLDGRLPSGQFNIGSSGVGLLHDHSAIPQLVSSLTGEGPEISMIYCAPGDYTALETRGANMAGGTGAQNVRISDIAIYKVGEDQLGTAFKAKGFAFGRFERLRTFGFGAGQVYEGAFSCEIIQPWAHSNGKGIELIPGEGDPNNPGGGIYCPNAIRVVQPYLSTNTISSLHAKRPVTLSVMGGSIENNGVHGGTSVGAWVEDAGYQGRVGVIFDGVYFEDNAGRADLFITNGENPCVYNIRGCTFNRINSAHFTEHNIWTDFSGGLRQILNLHGNGFGPGGDYVPASSRSYLHHTTETPIVTGHESNFWFSAIENKNLVRPSFESTGNTGNVVINSNGAVLPFPANVRSSGNYSTSDSAFYAPFTGMYQFTVSLAVNSVNTQASIGFAKNGSLDTSSIVRFTGVQPVSITRTLNLVEGDKIDVRSLMETGWSFDFRGFISSFSGQLIG